jgi:hypothetical protein
MFNPTIVFSGLIVFTVMGLILVYLMRLLATEALVVMDNLSIVEKHPQHHQYISTINTELYKSYPVYFGAIILNCVWLFSSPAPETTFLLAILAAAVNATTLVNMYNIINEREKFRDVLKEIGLIRDTSDDDEDDE